MRTSTECDGVIVVLVMVVVVMVVVVRLVMMVRKVANQNLSGCNTCVP